MCSTVARFLHLPVDVSFSLRILRRSALPFLLLFVALVPEAQAAREPQMLEGVAGYVEGRAEPALARGLQENGARWIAESVEEVRAEERARSEGASPLPIDPTFKPRVRAALKRRIKAWLPGQVRELIHGDLLGNVPGGEAAREAGLIAERVWQEMEGSLDAIVGRCAERLLDRVAERLQQRVGSVPGLAWLDMRDLEGSLRGVLDVGTLAGIGLRELAGGMGDATVAAIRGRVEEAFAGRLPPEVLEAIWRGPHAFDRAVARLSGRLPGARLRVLTDDLLGRPLIKLPSTAYAAILSASAASHYARAFAGPTVDLHELKRGVEVTRVMVWQLRNKESITISILQLGGLGRDIARRFGAGAFVDRLEGEIGGALDRIQRLADEIDRLALRPVTIVQGQLREMAAALQRELTALQEAFVAPVREELGRLRDELQRPLDASADAVVEGVRGVLPSGDELREAFGVDDALLEELRKIRPREALEAIGDDLAGAAATAGVAVVDAFGFLEKLGGILDVERVPAKHPAIAKELDPVFTHNGEFFLEIDDLLLPGRGLDLQFTRIYRARANLPPEFGPRWTHRYAERLIPLEREGVSGVTHITGRGRKFFFVETGGGFRSPPGVDARLVREGAGYRLRQRDGLATTYDAKGRMREKRDRFGNRLRFRYDARGQLAAVVDPFGRTVRIERRADGCIVRIIDPAGRVLSYRYNAAGELSAVVLPATDDHPKGIAIAYRYVDGGEEGARHLLAMASDPAGRRFLENRYDDTGRIIAQRVHGGPWRRVAYGPGAGVVAGRTWVTDAAGVTRLSEHDAEGHLLRRWRWDGERYHLLRAYASARGERVRDCLPSGYCRRWHGAGSARVRVEAVSNDGTPPRMTEEFFDDPFGRLTRRVEADGVETRVAYRPTPEGELVEVRRRRDAEAPWQLLERRRFDRFGQLREVVDAAGGVTRFTYYSAADPDGDGIPLEGATIDSDDGGGWLACLQRDARRRCFVYDPAGNIVRREEGGAVTTYGVDALNRVRAAHTGGGSAQRFVFDANGNVREALEGDGGSLRVAYDDADRIVSVRDGERFVSIESDPRDRVTAFRGEGEERRWEYDPDGRVRCVEGGGGRRCVERDADGALVVVRRNDGGVVRIERNGFGEVAAIEREGERRSFVRTAAGRIVAERASDGALLPRFVSEECPAVFADAFVSPSLVPRDERSFHGSAGALLPTAQPNRPLFISPAYDVLLPTDALSSLLSFSGDFATTKPHVHRRIQGTDEGGRAPRGVDYGDDRDAGPV